MSHCPNCKYTRDNCQCGRTRRTHQDCACEKHDAHLVDGQWVLRCVRCGAEKPLG